MDYRQVVVFYLFLNILLHLVYRQWMESEKKNRSVFYNRVVVFRPYCAWSRALTVAAVQQIAIMYPALYCRESKT